MECVVIGAGINGIINCDLACSALVMISRWSIVLNRGTGTSYGNAGILAAGAVLPVTVQGLIAKIPQNGSVENIHLCFYAGVIYHVYCRFW